MDEYQREIGEIEEQIEAMEAAEENPKDIAEFQMQLSVLRSIYEQAVRLLARGAADESLRDSLALRGYGEWNLDNVYAFVYETAVDLPADGHHSFVTEVRQADFADLLLSPA